MDLPQFQQPSRTRLFLGVSRCLLRVFSALPCPRVARSRCACVRVRACVRARARAWERVRGSFIAVVPTRAPTRTWYIHRCRIHTLPYTRAHTAHSSLSEHVFCVWKGLELAYLADSGGCGKVFSVEPKRFDKPSTRFSLFSRRGLPYPKGNNNG